jgi:hypothetical protein
MGVASAALSALEASGGDETGRDEASLVWLPFCSAPAGDVDGRAGVEREGCFAVGTGVTGGGFAATVGVAGGVGSSAAVLAVIAFAEASLDSGALSICFSASSSGAGTTGPDVSVTDFLDTGTGSVKRGGGASVSSISAAR